MSLPLRDEESPQFAERAAQALLALAQPPRDAHVAVIGHRTLPYMLALLARGCAAVRGLRPDRSSPDREAADLCWIVDVADEAELDEALRAARCRAGRIVLEDRDGRWRLASAALRRRALALGLEIVDRGRRSPRLLLVARRSPLAAAA